jgi:hypothetical protein
LWRKKFKKKKKIWNRIFIEKNNNKEIFLKMSNIVNNNVLPPGIENFSKTVFGTLEIKLGDLKYLNLNIKTPLE